MTSTNTSGLFGRVGEFDVARETFSAYVERMEMLFTANNIVETMGEGSAAANRVVANRKRAILLTEVGPEVYSTLSNLLAPAKPKDTQFTDIGLFQKKSTPPRRTGFWKFSQEGGSKTMEIQVEGGLNLKKSSAGVISTDSSCDSNIWFGDTLELSDPKKRRSMLFTYFSSDINDNLSPFAGPFISENANKILKKEPSQGCCNEEFETPDTFLLVPRPSTRTVE